MKNFLSQKIPIKFIGTKAKRCEVCFSTNIEDFINVGRVAPNCTYDFLPVSICKNCDLRFLNPRPSNKYFINYYKNNYRKKNVNNLPLNKDFDNYQIKRGESIYKFFKNKINFKKGIMLDHGCAVGLTMLAWKNNGWVTKGIDPNLQSVRYAKKYYKLSIGKFFGENIPIYKKKFDVILSLGSFEHSYDINSTLKKVVQNLNTNGNLIIRWRSDKMIGSPFEYYNLNHFRYFTRETWKVLLQKFGFINIKYFNKKIEKSDAYEYIICTKSSLIKSKKKIKKIKTKYVSYFCNYLNKYKKIASIVEKKCPKKFNLIDIEKIIISKKIGLLFTKRKLAILRFYQEVKAFQKTMKLFYENKS